MTALEDQSCPDCHQKRSLAYDPETNGWWQHHEVVCEACAALEQAREKSKDRGAATKDYIALDPKYAPGGPQSAPQDPTE